MRKTGWRGDYIMYKVGVGNWGGSIDRMGVVCARMSWLDRSKN